MPNDTKKWEGTFVALATPFADGKLDEAAYAKLCEEMLAEGCDGLVPCGTTGETPAMSAEEQDRCVRIAVEVEDPTAPAVVEALARAGFPSVDLAFQPAEDAPVRVCANADPARPAQVEIYPPSTGAKGRSRRRSRSVR